MESNLSSYKSASLAHQRQMSGTLRQQIPPPNSSAHEPVFPVNRSSSSFQCTISNQSPFSAQAMPHYSFFASATIGSISNCVFNIVHPRDPAGSCEENVAKRPKLDGSSWKDFSQCIFWVFPFTVFTFWHASAAENTPFSLQVTNILSALSSSHFRAVFIARSPSSSVYTQKTSSKTIFLHVFMFFMRNKLVKLLVFENFILVLVAYCASSQ